jgi:hypothetical protein
MLKGHTKIELMRDGKLVHSQEHDNAITPWMVNFLNKGDYFHSAAKTKLFPLSQWFAGCLLTDEQNDASTSMIAHNSNVIAQAGNDAYTGINLRRGSYNSNESHAIVDQDGRYKGFQYTWDWTTSQGNGTIRSVCLTRPVFGKTDIANDRSLSETSWVITENMSGVLDSEMTLILSQMSYLDLVNERGYLVGYSNGVITVREFFVNNPRYHLNGNSLDIINELLPHEIEYTLSGDAATISVSFEGNNIHIFTRTNTSTGSNYRGVLYEVVISMTNWSVTAERSFTYVDALPSPYALNNECRTNICPIVNGYVYVLARTSSTVVIIKQNLTNAADVDYLTHPVFANEGVSASNIQSYNGPAVILPNGDFIKANGSFTNNQLNLYFHNGTFYSCRATYPDDDVYVWSKNILPTVGGFICLLPGDQGRTSTRYSLLTCYPYVSTVNNLSSEVTKTADLTMKLTYTITEVEPE